MKMKELREKKGDELQKLILSFKKELFNLRFQKTYGQLAKSHRMRYVRRSVAKINTMLHANAMGGN